jgi:hypothetical protein
MMRFALLLCSMVALVFAVVFSLDREWQAATFFLVAAWYNRYIAELPERAP